MFAGVIESKSHEGGFLVSFTGSSPALESIIINAETGIYIGKVDAVLGNTNSPLAHVAHVDRKLDLDSLLGIEVGIRAKKQREERRERDSDRGQRGNDRGYQSRDNQGGRFERNDRGQDNRNGGDWDCPKCQNNNFAFRHRMQSLWRSPWRWWRTWSSTRRSPGWEAKDTRVETGKVDALRETTVDKTTATVETGTVQNVRIIISHSEQNAIDVEKPVVLVEDVVLDKTIAGVEAKDTRVETGKVDALKETTEDRVTVTVETGTVQNVEIIISHSEPNATHVDFQKAVAMTDVAEMTDMVAMTDVVGMTVVVKRKSTPITIGIVQNVKTQTSHSARNAIAAKHLALAPVAVADEANVEMMVEDHLVEIAAEDHHNAMTEEHLDAMMVEDLLNVTTDLEHLDAMIVEDLPNETMVQDLLDMKALDLLDVMAETDVATVAGIKAEVHTAIRTELLSVIPGSLETLENHVVMVPVMLITAHQNLSSTQTEMIEEAE